MNTIVRGWYGFALFTLSGLLPGCSFEVGDAPAEVERPQDIESHEEPVLLCNRPDGCCDLNIYESCSTSSRRASNGIQVGITIYTCRPSAESTTPSSTCRVDAEDLLIGGGAFTLGTFDAAITKSRPIHGMGGGWAAKSVGISGPVSHAIKAYAIGLQVLSNLRPVNIANETHSHVFSATTGNGSTFGGSVKLPAGEFLIGGGWTAGTGTFAVDAYATGMSAGTWHVNGAEFGDRAPSLTGEAIGLSKCVPAANPVVCFGPRAITEATSSGGNFLQGIVVNNPFDNQMVVGVGAISSSWSRPIWALFPLEGEGFGTPGMYGRGAAFTVAPTGDQGDVTAQLLTLGPT